jgi:uncharacterized protein
MNLVDTGPLVALLNEDDPYHRAANDATDNLPRGPMVTTWPVFTEAMYLLGKATGHEGQESLWMLLAGGDLHLRDAAHDEITRMNQLMMQYRDTPMDLADASLVAAAEAAGLRDIFSFDGHFRIYLLRDGSFLNVIP